MIRKAQNFEDSDKVRISKCNNVFVQAIFQISLKKILSLKNLKIMCHGHILLPILKLKILLERFMKKKFKKQIEFRVEKVIIRNKNL